MGKVLSKLTKGVTTRSTENNRTFKYERGSVTLNFTLNTDNKTQMKDFSELLKIGLSDVQEAMKNVPE